MTAQSTFNDTTEATGYIPTKVMSVTDEQVRKKITQPDRFQSLVNVAVQLNCLLKHSGYTMRTIAKSVGLVKEITKVSPGVF